MPIDLRDAGVAALVAAAGGLAYGLARLSGSGWLASTTPVLGAKGWQILNVGAYALSVASVSAPGRVDDEMAAQARRRARAADPAAGTGIPRDHWSRGCFAPAGWAFAIRGAIFPAKPPFGDVRGAPPRTTSRTTPARRLRRRRPVVGARVRLQSLWCAAFRRRSRPRRFWISAALLARPARWAALHRVPRVRRRRRDAPRRTGGATRSRCTSGGSPPPPSSTPTRSRGSPRREGADRREAPKKRRPLRCRRRRRVGGGDAGEHRRKSPRSPPPRSGVACATLGGGAGRRGGRGVGAVRGGRGRGSAEGGAREDRGGEGGDGPRRRRREDGREGESARRRRRHRARRRREGRADGRGEVESEGSGVDVAKRSRTIGR